MEEAVGYSGIAAEVQKPTEHALVLKQNRYFLLTNPHGDVDPPGQCSLGLFHDDTRVLSHYALRLRGGPPSLLGAEVPRSYAAFIHLAIPDSEFGGISWDPKNCVHVRRELVLSDRMIERLTLTSYFPRPITYWIELVLGVDFADIFEVRGWKRKHRGQYFLPTVNHEEIIFAYCGRDEQMMRTCVRFRDPPSSLQPKLARWDFELSPNNHFQIEWEIYALTPNSPRPETEAFGIDDQRHAAIKNLKHWQTECSNWSTPLASFQNVLTRAIGDLHALYIRTDGVQVISAGIPWYSTAFGRDSIIASLQTLPLNSRIALETLRYLAQWQGRRENAFTEEQPGKIMHELRRGELARTGEIPHVPYYGTIDATPLWLILLHETWQWTGDDHLLRELLPHAEAALDWITRYGDLDGDGFVEYAGSSSGKGLANQGWKDSGDGVPFPDGSLPEPPIALVEVQGYVFDAFQKMAAIYSALGKNERAEELHGRAAKLLDRIMERFWMEDLGTFALALDGRKQPLPTITSNAGHLLWSGVPDQRQAGLMAARLLSQDMFCGWGIRTLSASHEAFNPMSYHNGSVWPHDNALIVQGLVRYGLAESALPVLDGLHDVAADNEFDRLPELFCGMNRMAGMRPVWYPVSCSPQAWASGAFFMMLQSVLGIQPEARRRLLHVRNPRLPSFLDHLVIRNLAIGKSRVALEFRRHEDRTMANLLAMSGEPLQVRIELS
jgi:glycogen debranching enzyme